MSDHVEHREARAAVIARLDALLAATPLPPHDDEPAAVLDAFEGMARVRAPLLAELADHAAGHADDPDVRERHVALCARDRSWLDALGRARDTVDARLLAVRRRQPCRR